MKAMTESYIDIKEAARILGVSHRTIRDVYIKNDSTFPWCKVNPNKSNSPYRFLPSNLRKWREGQRIEREMLERKVLKIAGGGAS